MATIITVHGTGATGPEEGERWWQRGSPFINHISELIEGSDGKLYHQPIIWDGRNSELSRRDAATALLAAVRENEKTNGKYVIIGHSHGGSIISIALQRAALKRQLLPGLRRWITIGTPFIRHIPKSYQFMRIGLIGKATALSLYIMLFSALVFLLKHTEKMGMNVSDFLAATGLLGFVFLFVWNQLRGFESKDLRLLKPKSIQRADQRFSSLWVPIWHLHDEAINGLARVKGVAFPVFPQGFAMPTMTMLAIAAAPLGLVLLAYNDSLVATIVETSPVSKILGEGAPPSSWDIFDRLFVLLWGWPISLFDQAVRAGVPGALFLWILLFFVIAVASIYIGLLQVLLWPLSVRLSVLLNAATWRQLRGLAFGNDTLGEVAIDSSSVPLWTTSRFSHLPEELAEEIAQVSNEAAGCSIGKLRSAIDKLAFIEGGTEKLDFLGQYLSWNELIHTCYFSVARFRKLIAFSIAQCEGFCATEEFKADPDYPLVARWYSEMQLMAEQPPASSRPPN